MHRLYAPPIHLPKGDARNHSGRRPRGVLFSARTRSLYCCFWQAGAESAHSLVVACSFSYRIPSKIEACKKQRVSSTLFLWIFFPCFREVLRTALFLTRYTSVPSTSFYVGHCQAFFYTALYEPCRLQWCARINLCNCLPKQIPRLSLGKVTGSAVHF